MNAELVNSVLVFRLFAPSDAPQPKPSRWRRLGPAEFWHASTRSSDTGEHRASCINSTTGSFCGAISCKGEQP